MGQDKAMVLLRGITLLERVATTLTEVGIDVVVAGPRRSGFDLPVVKDATGRGPVAGLVGALDALPGRDLFVVGVDQPLLRAETVSGLLEIAGTVVAPVAQGVPQVTCSVYRASAVAPARIVLRSARASLRAVADAAAASLVAEEQWRSWGEDGRSWTSINTGADLVAMEARLATENDELRSSS
jgi:molybdopterin-guanine dinucleotide biosynthesis protein A